MTSETKRGKTPNGGTSSTIYYQDSQGQPAEKSEAVKALIVEYDSEGRSMYRTYSSFPKRTKTARQASLIDPDGLRR